jgi:hypothetical protein
LNSKAVLGARRDNNASQLSQLAEETQGVLVTDFTHDRIMSFAIFKQGMADSGPSALP